MTHLSDLRKPPIVLTIAGFDPSSGAGATADLQVFAAMGLFGTACLTALTVQSTQGVTRVQPVDAALLREMLRFLRQDMPPVGIKIGMLADAAVTGVVADFVEDWSDETSPVIVIDPVLQSSSGTSLLHEDARGTLLERLLPRAACVTPNQTELAVLLGLDREAPYDLFAAGKQLLERTGAKGVIVTGGEMNPPTDLLIEPKSAPVWLSGSRVTTSSTHGTGCAFSSALLCRLVLGDVLADAAKAAKLFVEGSLRNAPGLGSGKGPMKLSAAAYANECVGRIGGESEGSC